MRPATLLLVTVIFFLVSPGYGAQAGLEKGVFERPSNALLFKEITSGFSFIGKQHRKKITEILATVDRHHILVCEKSFTIKESDRKAEEFRINKISCLSSSIPKSEQYIIYSLSLQKEMLRRLLTARQTGNENSDNLGFLGKKSKRLVRKKKRIFNNYADVYFTELMSMIGEISDLQNQILAGRGRLATPLDKALEVKKRNVESFILGELAVLARNAKLIEQYAQ